MIGHHRGNGEAGAGDGGGQQEGAGFDAVGNDGVVRAVQPLDTNDGDGGGAGAPHLGPHGEQQSGEVHDLGLEGCVFNDGLTLREGGGHHQGLGGAHAGAVQMDASAGQAMAAAGHHGGDDAVLNGHLGAKGFQAFNVLHHRPGTDLAAPGEWDSCDAKASEQGANAEEAGPQAVDQLVGRGGLAQPGAVHLQGVAVMACADAQRGQNLCHPTDVGEGRDIAQAQLLAGEQAGRHQDQGRVLGTTDAELAGEAPTAGDFQLRSENLLRRDESRGHG